MKQTYIWDVSARAKPGERVQVFEDVEDLIATATNNYKVMDGVVFRQFIWPTEPRNYSTFRDLGDDYFSVRFRWDEEEKSYAA